MPFAVPTATFLGLVVSSVTGLAQAPYQPPPASSAAVAGIDFRSSQPFTALQLRYFACDRSDICDGRNLTRPFQCSTDPSRNTAFLKLKNGVIFFDAKMAIDADGSQLSQARGGTNLPQTAWHYPTPPRASVDAEHVPYIVLSKEFVASRYAGLRQGIRIQLGDIAAVVYKDRVRFALVADTGPPCKIGEGSMKLHDELGNRSCVEFDPNGVCKKASESGIEKNVLFFIFPNSAGLIARGLSPANVNQRLNEQGPKLLQALKSSP